MNKFTCILSLFLILSACQSSKNLKNNDIYTLLQTCFEDYYLNYDVEITPLLNDFELLLLKESHIIDTTGAAYKVLFDSLAINNYFSLPLKKEDFNNAALYKNPSNIIGCATEIFGIDSLQIIKTNFSKVSKEINSKIASGEDISIHYLFNSYKLKLTEEELRAPYIKQSVLLLLYRWYFKSKFDRDIEIEAF